MTFSSNKRREWLYDIFHPIIEERDYDIFIQISEKRTGMTFFHPISKESG